jgi:6-phosphogluconate dehydrogenase
MKSQRTATAALYAIPRRKLTPRSRAAFLRQLESALYAAKISAYAQGFAVMEQASETFHWQLPLGTVASIWRNGCIIRSRFLDLITKSYARAGDKGNLLLSREFVEIMSDNHRQLRTTVAEAAQTGLPVPALSAALAYFDSYRQDPGTANLIQAQRDFFGAHGFERSDEPGEHHGPWHEEK